MKKVPTSCPSGNLIGETESPWKKKIKLGFFSSSNSFSYQVDFSSASSAELYSSSVIGGFLDFFLVLEQEIIDQKIIMLLNLLFL